MTFAPGLLYRETKAETGSVPAICSDCSCSIPSRGMRPSSLSRMLPRVCASVVASDPNVMDCGAEFGDRRDAERNRYAD